jgi:iron complex transport system substrate-binding protein
MLFALGLGDQVVAVTHECDWPPQAASIPQLTRTVIPAGLSAREIDDTVRATVRAGRPLSLDDVLADFTRLGEATGVQREARMVREQARRRIAAVRGSVEAAPAVRTLAIEWLDPPFVAGHWVPEMIDVAGGRDVAGRAGQRSRTATWDELSASHADVAIVMPCGYDADRSAEEADTFASELARLDAERLVAVDASAYFSRPGPRLIDGVELLGHILHPALVAAPPERRFREVAHAGGGT